MIDDENTGYTTKFQEKSIDSRKFIFSATLMHLVAAEVQIESDERADFALFCPLRLLSMNGRCSKLRTV
jgi:hypothetical protein